MHNKRADSSEKGAYECKHFRFQRKHPWGDRDQNVIVESFRCLFFSASLKMEISQLDPSKLWAGM